MINFFKSKSFYRKVLITFFVCLLIVLPSLLLRAGVSIPFGGRITTVIPCLFSGGNMLITQIPVAGPPMLILRPGISKLYAYYQPTPGNNILGTAFGADVCIIFPFPPVVVPAPLITMIGTSGVAGAISSSGSSSGTNSNSDQNSNNQTNNDQSTQDTNVCSNQNRQASSYILANEGWRNDMYLDSNGNRTIGVGHKIVGNEVTSAHISDERVSELYASDLATARTGAMTAAANHGVDWSSLSATRQTVLTDMAFNMGSGNGQGLDGFNNMWAAIKNQDWSTASKEVYGSGYTGSRADRNSRAMASNDSSEINERINNDTRAREMCNSGSTSTSS